MINAMPAQRPLVLVTGSTGYIGGRLVPRLVRAGYRVRCFSRSRRKMQSRPWAHDDHIELIEGDALEIEDLKRAMQGCTSAYFLIHSMIAAGKAYAEVDRQLATSFAQAAEADGVKQIVYLGGLGETGEDLSKHLASRREVEDALASTSVPVTTLRAAMIIGSGSASFETLRYLVERLPIMITPRWVSTPCQPVGVRDVLRSLVAVLDQPDAIGKTFDIGSPDILSYRQIMQIMSRCLKLRKRLIIPVPVLTPKLSSLWIHLITPIDRRIAQPLAEGLRNKVVCRDEAIHDIVREPFLGVEEAIQLALERTEHHAVETSWSDAGVMPGDPDWAGGTVFKDERRVETNVTPDAAFRTVSRIGGDHGYWGSGFLWRLRGALDRLVGGPGLRRGRRDPDHVEYGDAVDFWRVTDVRDGERLELRAEMKVPGEATLSFDIQPAPGGSRIVQTARFKPKGLFGLVYWYAVLPLHFLVFPRMLRGVKREAESGS